MKNYNNEYFIALHNEEPKQFYIKTHKKSEGRRINGVRLALEAPIFFEPAVQDRDLRLNVQRAKTDFMFGKGSFIANHNVRKELIKYDINGMQLYPAVFVEPDGHWDESYWYLNIWQDLDCWDREKSIYEPIEDDWDEDDTVIDKYSLDAKILDKIPEEQRLMFRMGGESSGEVFIHQKLVDFFVKNQFTGIRFFKVSEFTDGDQY